MAIEDADANAFSQAVRAGTLALSNLGDIQSTIPSAVEDSPQAFLPNGAEIKIFGSSMSFEESKESLEDVKQLLTKQLHSPPNLLAQMQR